MIEGLQPYSEYRNPSLPWLEEIPRHWEMIPKRALMRDQRQELITRPFIHSTICTVTQLGGDLLRSISTLVCIHSGRHLLRSGCRLSTRP